MMGHFAAAEAERQLDLVALLEEAPDRPHLHLVVVDVDVRAHLDLLDLDDLLLLAGFGGFLLGLILEAAVVEDLGDRRVLIRGDLDEVHPGFAGELEGALNRHVAVILALVVDQLDRGDADFFVDAGAFLGGGGCFKRSANGVFSFELLQGS